jgi:hypothetical protein
MGMYLRHGIIKTLGRSLLDGKAPCVKDRKYVWLTGPVLNPAFSEKTINSDSDYSRDAVQRK